MRVLNACDPVLHTKDYSLIPTFIAYYLSSISSAKLKQAASKIDGNMIFPRSTPFFVAP